MNTAPVYVLLVDDEDALLGILASQLTDQFGYVTRVAHDGQEAIDLLSSQEARPSLIITDYDMPKVNGIELLQWVNEHQLEIPVILLTGASGTVAVEALRAGAYDYLRKEHLDLHRLGVTIQSVLERRLLRAVEDTDKARLAEAQQNQVATDRLHAVVTNLQPSMMDGFASLHSGLDQLEEKMAKLGDEDRTACHELVGQLHSEVTSLEATMRTFLELYAFASSHRSHLERIEQLLESTRSARRQ